jgi:arginine/lysine/ornithine decarboxylase
MNLYDKLEQYSKEGYYPMHMPGHKRNTELMQMVNPYSLDITEIEGFDNLLHPEDILRDGMELARDLYGSTFTHYLVGGSTAGLLAGIAACTKKGDKIAVARNSHKAVYNAIFLNELEPVYIYPQIYKQFGLNCGLNFEIIEELLITNPEIKLIVITSPTYEGILSDIPSIANVAHKYGVPLLVDEAHGAHLGFHPNFPRNAIQGGADVVIHSIHKTLPAFTQSALIHVNSTLVDSELIKKYINIYQTTSPSYLLMAGMEKCITLLTNHSKVLFEEFYYKLEQFYQRMRELKHIKVLTRENVISSGSYDWDPSKITISVKGTNLTGSELYCDLLNTYKIQMEMVSKDYVLGMTSIADTAEGFQRLGDALDEIDSRLYKDSRNRKGVIKINESEQADVLEDYKNIAIQSYQAAQLPSELMPFDKSNGKIIADYIYLYPPGIPLLVPGERMNEYLLQSIKEFIKSGFSVHGLVGNNDVYINVIIE